MGAAAVPSAPPPEHVAWVSDWRLRAALGSPHLLQDLVLQLRVVSIRGESVLAHHLLSLSGRQN